MSVPIIKNTRLEGEVVTVEDLSNALNGALACVQAHLRRMRVTPVQIQSIVNEALAKGVEAMRDGQKARADVPRVKVVQ